MGPGFVSALDMRVQNTVNESFQVQETMMPVKVYQDGKVAAMNVLNQDLLSKSAKGIVSRLRMLSDLGTDMHTAVRAVPSYIAV